MEWEEIWVSKIEPMSQHWKTKAQLTKPRLNEDQQQMWLDSEPQFGSQLQEQR